MSNKNLKYFNKDNLILKDVIEGAKMWGIALENVMLTYFEIKPDSSFPAHHHESEQITMVLDGELFFKTDDSIICVKAGEVVAIPSDVLHGVYTKEKSVKAIDAWSPVMDKYKK